MRTRARSRYRIPLGWNAPWLLALVVYAPLACGEAPAETSPIVETDSAGVAIVTNDLARLDGVCRMDDAPRVTIGEAEGEEAYQLYRAFGGTILGDGRIALVNQGSQELRFYSGEGEYLGAAGGPGEGPGEFSDAFHLWTRPNGEIWVGDYRPWHFEVFDTAGTWLRGVRPEPAYPNPPGTIGVLDDGRMVVASGDVISREPAENWAVRQLSVVLHDSGGALIDTIAVIPNGRWGRTMETEWGLVLYPWFESFAEVAAGGDRYYSGHGSRAELRVHTLRGDAPALARIVRWTGQDRTLTDEDVAAAKQELEDQYAEQDPAIRERMLAPLVHESRPVADSLPAFISITLGRDGATWLKEHPRPGAVPRLLRFDAAGRYECAMAAPDGLQVWEVGADYVLGLARDELGIERVMLYAWEPVDP